MINGELNLNERLTFEEFQRMVIQDIKERNNHDLFENFEKHIIYKDFSENSLGVNSQSFFATIYFADVRPSPYSIETHKYQYCEIFNEVENRHDFIRMFHSSDMLYGDKLDAIAMLYNIFTKNRNSFFDVNLERFHTKRNKAV